MGRREGVYGYQDANDLQEAAEGRLATAAESGKSVDALVGIGYALLALTALSDSAGGSIEGIRERLSCIEDSLDSICRSLPG